MVATPGRIRTDLSCGPRFLCVAARVAACRPGLNTDASMAGNVHSEHEHVAVALLPVSV